jgi:hypothetical protein
MGSNALRSEPRSRTSRSSRFVPSGPYPSRHCLCELDMMAMTSRQPWHASCFEELSIPKLWACSLARLGKGERRAVALSSDLPLIRPHQDQLIGFLVGIPSNSGWRARLALFERPGEKALKGS